MLKSCSCTISFGRAFHCLIILTKNDCKKQFTLANDYNGYNIIKAFYLTRQTGRLNQMSKLSQNFDCVKL